MALGKRGYASLPLDGRPQQTDDIGILENVCVPSEITLGKQFSVFLTVFWVGPQRHQQPQSESARGLGSTTELTFLSHALVRLGGASYSILKLVILGWQ